MDAEARISLEETRPIEISIVADPGPSRHLLSRRSSLTVPDDYLTPRPRFDPVDLSALDYVGSYDHNLMCAICHCPFVSPIKLDCEHIFCQCCVNQAIKHQDRNARSCPSCRRRIDQYSTTAVPKILNRILDELLVKCPHSPDGCLEEVPRCRVQDHVLKYCSFSQVDCPSEDCLFTVRRRDTDGNRCLHYRVECEDCKQLVMKKDMETHQTLKCEVGRTSCPDCNDQVLVRDLESHISCCPDAIFPCTAASYGCDFIARLTALDEHLKACPLAKLMPFLKMQNERLEAHEVVLKHLRHKNSILETSFCTIQDTLSPSATLMDTSLTEAESSDAGPFDSTAHHLLCLHESLREEVSRVSTAVSEIDAKASMMAMNERLRAKEDLAHTNAAIGSMRMQLHWLMSARLQNQQRVAMIRTQSSGDGLAVDGSSPSMDPSNGSTIPIRRLSDSARQVPKRMEKGRMTETFRCNELLVLNILSYGFFHYKKNALDATVSEQTKVRWLQTLKNISPGWFIGNHLSSSLPGLGALHTPSYSANSPTRQLSKNHDMHLALAMAEFEQMAPLFQKLTRLLLHNVRYHPKVVSRKNLDDFIVMVQDPIRLAHVYDQLELLRHDLKMGNIIAHDEVVYLVALTKHLPDPRHDSQYQITRPPVTRASSQRSSGGAGSAVGQSTAGSEDEVE